MELELDFSDHEELEFANRDELSSLATHIEQVIARLAHSFSVGNAIKNGIPVAIIGETNAGKSTLLNALLNEEKAIVKLRLGIPKEKKSFDAFYFPYANSYIIYEVMRENGAYCVVAAKSQGRVFFRFIDAPFQQDWFIDEHNVVHSEWGRIREHIGLKIQITAQVTSYEMYRDIIFGLFLP